MPRHTPDLYPPIPATASGYLAVDAMHTLYWEVCGRNDGMPVLVLHGGPGGGIAGDYRRFFDPNHYRIVLFDQRGAGRSRPHAATAANTTQDLVADIERLRRHLGIERWLVMGGSWGATLALAYAEAQPERVTGLILRGVFLGHSEEIRWFVHGMRTVFPETWRRFAEHVPEAERDDLLRAYHSRLMNPDPALHLPAARAWARYEAMCATLLPCAEPAMGHDHHVLALARLEAHYFINGAFLDDGELLDGVSRIRRLPGVIVQGRYDMICPIVSADELRRAWPGARFVVVPDAGHSAMEPGIRRSLVSATERFKTAT